MEESEQIQIQTRMLMETRAVWATVASFLLGGGIGVVVLQGTSRPLAGAGSVAVPAALIAGAIAAAAFTVSTLVNRRGETDPMPRWQRWVSDLSAVAVAVAFAAVTGFGVLLIGQVLFVGLVGLTLSAWAGALLTGVASAVGARVAFSAGEELTTRDLAGLLFGFLTIGTLFAMLTASNPQWWEQNFSQLGSGEGSWAFNGTLAIAGLLIATVGSYIGRDLHRVRGDSALGQIAGVVALWAATGVGLALVGVFPVNTQPTPHNIVAFATLVLFVCAAVLTTVVMPGPPRALAVTTGGVVVFVIVSAILSLGFRLFSVTALEAIIIGLGLLWIATLVRTLAVLTPPWSRPSKHETLLPTR